MKSITNSITNDIYNDAPAPTTQPEPKRKHAKVTRYHKSDVYENLDNRMDTKELVDTNDRLHKMQQDFKNKKFLGLI